MRYTRICTSATGEPRFEDGEIALQLREYAPPTGPVLVSDFTQASQYAILRVPGGWDGGLHCVPNRQVFFILSGTVEVEVSSGEARRFGPGSIVLAEDTTGTGHDTRVVSGEDWVTATVHLRE